MAPDTPMFLAPVALLSSPLALPNSLPPVSSYDPSRRDSGPHSNRKPPPPGRVGRGCVLCPLAPRPCPAPARQVLSPLPGLRTGRASRSPCVPRAHPRAGNAAGRCPVNRWVRCGGPGLAGSWPCRGRGRLARAAGRFKAKGRAVWCHRHLASRLERTSGCDVRTAPVLPAWGPHTDR